MKKSRIIAFAVAVALCAAVFFGRLIDLQIVNGESYYKKTLTTITKKTSVAAGRGEVLDRYGRPLIKNVMKYVAYIERSFIPQNSYNESLLRIANLFREKSITYTDTFPISFFPYRFKTKEEDKQTDYSAFSDFLVYYGIKNNGSAADVVSMLSDKLKLGNYAEDEKRILIGLRYDMYKNGTTTGVPLLFADNIDIGTVTVLEENAAKYPGVIIEAETESTYVYPGYASHILGRVGKISAEEYEALKDDGYTINSYVGKDGIQKSFENYLRGVDGVKTTYLDSNYNIIGSDMTTPVKNGDNVVLTIDIELQMAVEDALADMIKALREDKTGKYKNGGKDADAGAVVVLDVKTGELLAMASNPTYDLTTFNDDYSSLVSDSGTPLLNRAIGGSYEPGSTFKMITALMGLNEGLITANTVYRCTGRYTYYHDYQPYCYGHYAHGDCTVDKAIRVSCNAFFFDVIRQLGIAKHNVYSGLFGFGRQTGVELAGEVKGYYLTKEIFDARGLTPGDQLMVSIGQLNTVTPIQLASYVQMLASADERYQPHLLKEVVDSGYNNVVFTNEPAVLSRFSDLGIKQKDIKTVQKGMIGVVTGNAARNALLGPYKAAAKTGTAEVPGGSPNAVFITYAPYDDPEIAIAAVVEHGGEGGYLVDLIAAVMNKYFSGKTSDASVDVEGTLIR